MELLKKAIRLDRKGQIMKASALYKRAIKQMGKQIDENDSDSDTRNKSYGLSYYDQFTQYRRRIREIEEILLKRKTEAILKETVAISANQRGLTYETLYGKFLKKDAQEIRIEEPEMSTLLHFEHLSTFLSVAMQCCPKLKYVEIFTQIDEANPDQQWKRLQRIRDELDVHKIDFHFSIDKYYVDKCIILSNGYVFQNPCGLHIFQQFKGSGLGRSDFSFRSCHETVINIYLTESNVCP